MASPAVSPHPQQPIRGECVGADRGRLCRHDGAFDGHEDWVQDGLVRTGQRSARAELTRAIVAETEELAVQDPAGMGMVRGQLRRCGFELSRILGGVLNLRCFFLSSCYVFFVLCDESVLCVDLIDGIRVF